LLDVDYVEILKVMYPDAHKDIDKLLPKPLVDEVTITVLVDSEHAHDKVKQRSITGIIMFAARKSILYSSRRQGTIVISTYGAEFCAMKTCMEGLILLRYMLRYSGFIVLHASLVGGDSLGEFQTFIERIFC
jgi:hypothetical protein